MASKVHNVALVPQSVNVFLKSQPSKPTPTQSCYVGSVPRVAPHSVKSFQVRKTTLGPSRCKILRTRSLSRCKILRVRSSSPCAILPVPLIKVLEAVSCWVVFFPAKKKRPGIKPLSGYPKCISYGNSQYFSALPTLQPLADPVRRRCVAFSV